MLDKAFIAKCIGSTCIAVGAGTGGYVYWDDIKDAWNSENKTFLVQAQSSISIGETYSCSLTGSSPSLSDNSCKLRALSYQKEKTYIEKSEVIESSLKFDGNTKDKHLYKLRIDTNKIKDIKEGSIIVLSSGQTTTNLKVVASLSNWKKDDNISSKKILVKAKSSYLSTDTSTPVTCKSGTSPETTINCDIYKFENQNIHKHNFDFTKIKKVVNLNEIQADHFYFVDFTSHTTQNDLTIEKFKNLSFEHSSNKVSASFISEVFTNFETLNETEKTNNKAVIRNIDNHHDSLLSTYLIGQSEEKTESFDDKNFKCKTGTTGSEKTDENCYIVDLKDIDRTSLSINKASSIASVENLKVAKNYFKIFVNNDILSKITKWDGTEKVEIVNKSTSSTAYGSLKIVALVEAGKISKGKTGTALTHAKDAITIAESTTIETTTVYQCTVGSDTNECDIYKIDKNKALNEKEIISQISSSSPKLAKVATKDDWKQDNFYFVDLKNKNILDAASKVDVSITLKTGNTAITTLKVKNLFANYDGFTLDNSSKLLLLPDKPAQE